MIDLRATTELLEAARELGACEEALEDIQPGQEVTNYFLLKWVDDRYEYLPVPASTVPFCLYATYGFGAGYDGCDGIKIEFGFGYADLYGHGDGSGWSNVEWCDD